MVLITSFIFASLIFFLILAMFTGAPLVPSKPPTVERMLKLLNLKKGQILYDLGSGDGKILITAAKQGAQGIGIEINPYAVLLSWVLAILAGVVKSVHFEWGNYWQHSLSAADAVVVYAMPQFMPRLAVKLQKELKKGTRIVSNTFTIPQLKLVKQERVGFDKVYLYEI